MSYTVLRTHLLKEKLAHSHFDSATVAGRLILLGTSEGSLLVYTLEEHPNTPEPYRLKGVDCRPGYAERLLEKGASKKAITQLAPMVDCDIILSLVDGFILVHRLSDLYPLHIVKNCKGIVQFVLKKENNRWTIAAHNKRRLLIFDWKENGGCVSNGEFHFTREFTLADSPKTLHWAGKCIILGCRKEYGIIDVSTPQGVQTELFTPGKAQIPVGCNLDSLRELLLVRDNMGIRINLEGKPAGKFGINWTSIPTQITYLHPYVIAVHPDHLEVHNPQREANVIQVVPLKNIELLSSSALQNLDTPHIASISHLKSNRNSFPSISNEDHAEASPGNRPSSQDDTMLIATTTNNSIFLVEVIPVNQQLRELCAQNRFEDAIALYNVISPDKLLHTTLREVNWMYALKLFAQQNYHESMKRFALSGADPRSILQLFPDLVPECLSSTLHQAPFLAADHSAALSTRTISDKKQYNAAIQALIPYLLKHRAPVAVTLLEPENSSNSALLVSSCIDTALVKAMASCTDTTSVTVSEFLSQPNACVLQDTATALRTAELYIPLSILYATRGQHREALNLLHNVSLTGQVPRNMNLSDPLNKLTSDYLVDEKLKKAFLDFAHQGLTLQEISTLPPNKDDPILDNEIQGTTHTILYMHRLEGSDPSVRDTLIFPYLEWILVNIPAAYALQSLWHENWQRVVQPDEVINFIDRLMASSDGGGLDLHIAYLELVTDGRTHPYSNDTSLYNTRALMYLKKLQRNESQQTIQFVQSKLTRFLNSCTRYNAASLLTSFSAPWCKERLFTERIGLLQRMRRHDIAIQALLHERNDFDAALKYCEEANAYEERILKKGNSSTSVLLLPTTTSAETSALSTLSHTAGLKERESDNLVGDSTAKSVKTGPSGNRKNVFVLLLESVLSQCGNQDSKIHGVGNNNTGVETSSGNKLTKQQIQNIMQILNTHHDKLDTCTVLSMLHDSMTISTMTDWLNAVLQRSIQEQRYATTLMHVSKEEVRLLQQDLLDVQRPHVTITSQTRCPRCRRTIQDSVFLRYPNGVVVHQACVGDDEKLCPVTQTTFNEFQRYL